MEPNRQPGNRTWHEYGLDRVATELDGALKNSIRVACVDRAQTAESRLGGRPNLPYDFAWPVWNEASLAFVAQIDLAALPEVEGIGLPRRGALYFFFEAARPYYRQEDRGFFRVIFSDHPLSRFPLRPFSPDLPPDLCFQPARLAVDSVEVPVPTVGDQELEKLALSEAEEDAWYTFREEWDSREPEPRQILAAPTGVPVDEPYGIHRIGGYPDYVIHDPRLAAHLISQGLDCSRAGAINEGQRRGLSSGAADWELLLQVDSEQAAGICWGDTGTLYFLLHKEDLRARKFEKRVVGVRGLERDVRRGSSIVV